MALARRFSVDAYDSFGTIAAEWEALADQTGSPPFLRPGWFAAFVAAFGGRALQILAARRDGRLIGVVPLQRGAGVLRSVTNWHTPEFAAVYEDETALHALAEALCERHERRVSLWFVNPANPDYEAIRASAGPRGRRLPNVEAGTSSLRRRQRRLAGLREWHRCKSSARSPSAPAAARRARGGHIRDLDRECSARFDA